MPQLEYVTTAFLSSRIRLSRRRRKPNGFQDPVIICLTRTTSSRILMRMTNPVCLLPVSSAGFLMFQPFFHIATPIPKRKVLSNMLNRLTSTVDDGLQAVPPFLDPNPPSPRGASPVPLYRTLKRNNSSYTKSVEDFSTRESGEEDLSQVRARLKPVRRNSISSIVNVQAEVTRRPQKSFIGGAGWGNSRKTRYAGSTISIAEGLKVEKSGYLVKKTFPVRLFSFFFL